MKSCVFKLKAPLWGPKKRFLSLKFGPNMNIVKRRGGEKKARTGAPHRTAPLRPGDLEGIRYEESKKKKVMRACRNLGKHGSILLSNCRDRRWDETNTGEYFSAVCAACHDQRDNLNKYVVSPTQVPTSTIT